MGTPFRLISRDAQQALTEFSEQFDAAFIAAEPTELWSKLYGLAESGKAYKTTYPLPISAAGYRERLGDDVLRTLGERSVSVIPYEHQDGVEIPKLKVEAPDFVGWTNAPARIAVEAVRYPNKLAAAMLHANPLLDLYRIERPGGSTASAIRLFANNHPVNILDSTKGTFDNLHTPSVFDVAWIEATKIRFRGKKAPNGESMGLRFNGLLIPAALEEQMRNLFERDSVVEAIADATDAIVGGIANNNRHKGTVKLIVADELLDDDVVYPMDIAKGIPPWIVQDGGVPEEIRYDEDSDFYKNTGKIAVKYILTMAATAALPHAIEKHTLT